jgi:predicted metal-dependent phosphoesterase TrpH
VRIDLHTHSTASDGTDSPDRLIEAAAAADLDVVAITDHDTTSGWAEAVEAARRSDIVLVRGAEVSCRWEGISLHLLGYLFDPSNAPLAKEMETVRDDRVARLRHMVDSIATEHDITWAQVERHAGGDSVGRPHIADALVESGVVASRDEAFEELLHNRSRHYRPHIAPDPINAVRLVRDAGGVPVFAHPGARGRGHVVPDSLIAEMAAAGLGGLEVDHRDHDPLTRDRLRALASDLGLLVTGSSDYHGAGKLNRLGENLTSPAAYDAIVSAATGVALVAS